MLLDESLVGKPESRDCGDSERDVENHHPHGGACRQARVGILSRLPTSWGVHGSALRIAAENWSAMRSKPRLVGCSSLAQASL